MRAVVVLAVMVVLCVACDEETTGAEVCGDGVIDMGEECDTKSMPETTCTELGYYEQVGALTCTAECTVNLSVCTGGRCGDGTIQTVYGEQCDGEDLAATTCQTLGYGQGSGALGCTAGCLFDEAACVPISTNADLTSLTVSGGTLTPLFAAATTSYVVTVGSAVPDVTVTAVAADPLASVEIAPVQPMELMMGNNPVTVTVTAESGAQKLYSVVITLDYDSPFIGALPYVPGGTFQRDATLTNLATVTPFRMSRHEITRAQWAAVTGWPDPSDTTYSSGVDDPVQQVSWYDAIAFCNRLSLLEGLTPVYSVSGVDFASLTYDEIPTTSSATWNAVTADWGADGYRLPTELEWMWAAMGADTEDPGMTNTTGYLNSFSGSTGVNAIGEYAVFGYSTAEVGRTTTERSNPVGSKLPNELGLYDLSGNAIEWTWDWYDVYPEGPVTDYRGAASGTSRLRRGGGWGSTGLYCTVAYRNYSGPSSRLYGIGFRVVCP